MWTDLNIYDITSEVSNIQLSKSKSDFLVSCTETAKFMYQYYYCPNITAEGNETSEP